MEENKQAILDKFVECLQLTDNAGFAVGNPLAKLQYIDDGHEQIVRPVFADGTGEDGYYDICVTWDSGTAMLCDICNQFIRKMW
jgi:hypothetical protein